MLSFSQRRNLYGDLTKDTSTANLAFGDVIMSEEDKRIINMGAWDFTQRLFTEDTVASQQFYNLPVNYRKLIGNPTITVGSILYTPLEAPDRRFWDRLTSVADTSDVPQYFFIFNNQIGFFPTPATNGNTITLPYEIQQKDLSIPDFTTGTITSITNGASALVGSGTSWTAGMVGRFIRIDDDNTADTGDNEWYEVSAVGSTTAITLSIPYEGTTIASATQSYTLAQMSILPDGYDRIPVYRAAWDYNVLEDNPGMADRFRELYIDSRDQLIKDRGTKTSDLVVERRGRQDIRNPNLFVRQ